MRDFNDCLQTLCRALIKYSETSIRAVCETASMKESRLMNLIYIRERQSQYYKWKCEQFVEDIDKMINAKMTEKGNQLIYELDSSNW